MGGRSHIPTEEGKSVPFLPPKPMCHRLEYMQTTPPSPSEVLGRIQAEEGTRAVKLNPTSSKPPCDQM